MPWNPEETLAAAMQAFQKDDLEAADRLARAILQRTRDHAQAQHLRALVAYRSGKHAVAVRQWRHLAERFPACVEFHYNLAIVLEETGEVGEAESAYRRALVANPDWADAHFNLGLLLRRQDRLGEAADSFRRAISCRPGHPDSHNNLGEALLELGDVEGARTCLNRALELQPGLARAHNNLGKVSAIEKRFAAAAGHFESALALDPVSESAWNNLGLALHAMGESDRAEQAFHNALAARPDNLRARWNLFTSRLKVIYRSPEEVVRSREAYLHDLEELDRTCRLDSPGAITEAAEAVGSTQPFYLAYQGEVDRDLQVRYGALVARIMAARFPSFAVAPRLQPSPPGERIRVGFVSRWFVNHSVWKIPVRGWVRALDRKRFRLYGYHTGHERDDRTAEAESMFDVFVQGPLSVESWCERIRADAPHILIFPEIGMDPFTAKLGALRLAPVQGSTWGHPDTTGLPTLDFYLSSSLMEPEGAEAHYSERLVRLPNLSIHYQPSPTTGVFLARERFNLPGESVLYWCPQSLYKYLPQYDDVFPRIASGVPRARFVFIRYGGGEGVNAIFRERMDGGFRRFGLSASEYCTYLPRLDAAEFDAMAGLSDLFLDSIGWSGCNTTLEALARDLPVITLPGATMRSRHSAAFLERMGIRGTTAKSIDEYVAIATAMGLDPALRAAASADIRKRKEILYNDRECIQALEEFLISQVQENS